MKVKAHRNSSICAFVTKRSHRYFHIITVNTDALKYHLYQHPFEITEVIKLISHQLNNHYSRYLMRKEAYTSQFIKYFDECIWISPASFVILHIFSYASNLKIV